MSLHIQMLGTGSAFAKERYNNSALLRTQDKQVMIDCGSSVPRSLHELQIQPDRIDGILITHIHADHVGGLEEMAFRLLYEHGRKRTKLFIAESLAVPLWENTLKGGLYSPSENLLTLEDYFDVVLLPERASVELFPGLTVEIIPTEHIQLKPSYSLFINDRTFYSADIRFNPELLIGEVIQQRNCHTIFHDCQLSGQGFVHTTLEELLTLPEEVQQRIYLMHYDDSMPDYIGRTGQMSFVQQHQIIDLT
ncbi:MBL fold metallo-hydrolase [Paenibacillus whitsoniae]|uniref:Ribonuclease Z n=1 Tax=Paenibacillus whitsoniae TaxID=2496558 RepID=A0A3S0BR19_9BACL|nr:MBL fold metallo-hydrolase [Paenibacillus whitsoniae]RTE03572.1 ribonuclease Z [Paenibacillus whitsoniae]